ncbi:MAG TPA: hypothetical protein VGW75_15235 [Solirubrobacteraceae bacterium]|jgi:hypothetical protein|nr:hypothetical protein [Solirubrobacteraceae bacterium]
MLFDLRGRGRRRTVQVIYVSLALLMGGGLVLFGIGGDVQGGLLDAFREDSGSANDVVEKQVDEAEKRIRANRGDAAAWAALARAKLQLAGQTDGFDANTRTYGGDARRVVGEATRAWEKHLQLAKNKPDADVAALMTQAFISLERPADAVRTQEIVIDATKNPGFGQYSALAQYAYLAGQIRKGDLATQKALDDAEEEGLPKERRDRIKAELESFKQAAVQQAAQDATGGTGAPTAP